jgi:putative phosphoribosyl transferase
MRFADRTDAGRRLAARLETMGLVDAVVLALPRGGVPVAAEVATALGAPLDVLVARKLGAPFQPELGVGAIAEDGIIVLEDATLASLGLTRAGMAETIEQERAELERRVTRYRGDRPREPVAGRTVIVVDDGLATGVTARAALRSIRTAGPARTILAVPVGPPNAQEILAGEADDVVCIEQPERLAAVGQWYRDFEQTDDGTVVALLQAAQHRRA